MNKKILIGAVIGSTFEMYDFGIYFILTAILAKIFFPNQHGAIGYIAVYGVTLVSCLARPIGGLLYGHFGDKTGRKNTLIFSITLMALPSFIVGALPSYQSIGIAAPIILFLLRILQGAAVGGDTPGAMIFVTEHAKNNRLGSVGAWIIAGANAGIAISLIIALVLQHCLGSNSMQAWGWRIPFLLGGLLAALGLFLRKHSQETPAFLTIQKTRSLLSTPCLQLCRKYKCALLHALGSTLFMAAGTGVLIAFMPTYLQHYLHYQASTSLWICLIYNLAVCMLTVYFGYYYDRNPKTFSTIRAILLLSIYSIPLYYLLQQNDWIALSALYISAIPLAMIFGTISITLQKLFLPEIRYSAVALSYNLAFASSGGFAAIACIALITTWHSLLMPGMYLLLFGLLGSVLYIVTKAGCKTQMI